ncbi:hypothetical protein FRC11_012574 [Ceratobasidium sp. 423]|nr:hypothetical protein FRC11_012574 [Ceratobasidium sp. 423]
MMTTPPPTNHIYLHCYLWKKRLGELSFYDDWEETGSTSDCDEADNITALLAMEEILHREEVSRLCEVRDIEFHYEHTRFEHDKMLAIQNNLDIKPFIDLHIRLQHDIFLKYDALIRKKRVIRKERRRIIMWTGRAPAEEA